MSDTIHTCSPFCEKPACVAARDRALLEAAAKAAGYETDMGRELEPRMHIRPTGSGYDQWRWWNPLTNSGDALELAVKLRLLVDFWSCCAMNLKNSEDDWFGGVLDDARIGCSPDEVDGAAATRRAIVRVAADLANQGTQA